LERGAFLELADVLVRAEFPAGASSRVAEVFTGSAAGRYRSGLEGVSNRASVFASNPGMSRSENPAMKHQTMSRAKVPSHMWGAVGPAAAGLRAGNAEPVTRPDTKKK
jgi:hypothetical protein